MIPPSTKLPLAVNPCPRVALPFKEISTFISEDPSSSTGAIEALNTSHLPTSPPKSPAKEGAKQASKVAKRRGKGWSQQEAKPGKEKLVDVVLSDCEGEFGPKTSSPDRGNVCTCNVGF